MSTFFEKLTGSRPETKRPAPLHAAPDKEEALRQPRRAIPESRETAKPMHLKVETEERPSPPAQEEATMEEGELTVDIFDQEGTIIIQSTVAGVKPEDLDVTITSDTVTIRGRRERDVEVAEDNYYYKELFWGSFSRSVILPEEIDEDAAEAVLKHGLLTIRLPKKKRGVVQKLKVKVT